MHVDDIRQFHPAIYGGLHEHVALVSIFAATSWPVLHAVKTKTKKKEQEILSLMSEERLLGEQMEIQRSGGNSASTPVRICFLHSCKDTVRTIMAAVGEVYLLTRPKLLFKRVYQYPSL